MNERDLVAKQPEHLGIADQMSKEILDRFEPELQNEIIFRIKQNVFDHRSSRISQLKEDADHLAKVNDTLKGQDAIARADGVRAITANVQAVCREPEFFTKAERHSFWACDIQHVSDCAVNITLKLNKMKETLIDFLDFYRTNVDFKYDYPDSYYADLYLKSINEAQNESLNVSDNEKQKEFCNHQWMKLKGEIHKCYECDVVKIEYTK